MLSERMLLLGIRMLDPRRLVWRLKVAAAGIAAIAAIWITAVHRAGEAVERRGRSRERRHAQAAARIRVHERRWFRQAQAVERELGRRPKR